MIANTYIAFNYVPKIVQRTLNILTSGIFLTVSEKHHLKPENGPKMTTLFFSTVVD